MKKNHPLQVKIQTGFKLPLVGLTTGISCENAREKNWVETRKIHVRSLFLKAELSSFLQPPETV